MDLMLRRTGAYSPSPKANHHVAAEAGLVEADYVAAVSREPDGAHVDVRVASLVPDT